MRKLDLNPQDDSVDLMAEATPAQEIGRDSDQSNTPLDASTLKTDNQAVQNVVATRHTSSAPSNQAQSPNMKKSLKKILPMLILAVIAGVGTGFGAHRLTAKDTGVPLDGNIQKIAGDEISNGEVFGSADENTFKDTATGYLEAGGLEGEGSHKLLRPGGDAQTVYLTSTVTDLTKLEGMEVQIWGETFKGQKAGWLMDVGRVKVVETQGKSPVEE